MDGMKIHSEQFQHLKHFHYLDSHWFFCKFSFSVMHDIQFDKTHKFFSGKLDCKTISAKGGRMPTENIHTGAGIMEGEGWYACLWRLQKDWITGLIFSNVVLLNLSLYLSTSGLSTCGLSDTYISVTFVPWSKMFHTNCAPILVQSIVG